MTLYKKGVDHPGSPGGSAPYLKVSPGESTVFTPLVELEELISIDLHGFWSIEPAVLVPCIHDSGCIACKLGNTPRYRAYMPVMTADGNVQILSAGIRVIEQLKSIAVELENSIVSKVFKLSRRGSGLSTKWTVVPLGKRVKIPTDLELPTPEEMIGVSTVEDIEKVMAERGLWVEKKKASKIPPKENENDSEDSDEADDDGWDIY